MSSVAKLKINCSVCNSKLEALGYTDSKGQSFTLNFYRWCDKCQKVVRLGIKQEFV